MNCNPKKPEHVSLIKSGRYYKVFNAETRFIYRMPALGAKIVRMCNGKNGLDDIKAVMNEKYGLRKKDVETFISELNKKGLVETE